VIRHELEENITEKGTDSDAQGDDPLIGGEAINMDFHCERPELDNEELPNYDDYPHKDEHSIGEDSFENVELIVDLPGGEHVEDLQKDEYVKDEGEVAGGGLVLERFVDRFSLEALHHAVKNVNAVPLLVLKVGMLRDVLVSQPERGVAAGLDTVYEREVVGALDAFRNHLVRGKDNDDQDNALVDCLPKNVLDHLLVDDVLVLPVGRSLKKLLLGKLSRQSKRCKGVHDKVDPQQLDGGQRTLPEDARSNERND